MLRVNTRFRLMKNNRVKRRGVMLRLHDTYAKSEGSSHRSKLQCIAEEIFGKGNSADEHKTVLPQFLIGFVSLSSRNNMSLKPKRIDFEKTWNELKGTIKEVVTLGRVKREEWNSRFVDIYSICVAHPEPLADKLYSETKAFLEEHVRCLLKEKVSQPTMSPQNSEQSAYALLQRYHDAWAQYSKGVEFLNHLYLYLNQQHIKKQKLSEVEVVYGCINHDSQEQLEIGELGLDIWRQQMIVNVGDALVAQLLEGIRNDRLNTTQRSDMEHIIKGTIQSFVCVQEYKKKGSLILYQQTFEAPLLQDSGEFYKLEANRLLQMVAPEDVPQSNMESTGTFGKLKQTLSSSLLTAQDRVNKMSPRPSLIPDTESSGQSEPATSTQQSNRAAETPKPVGRSGSCRICLKAFKPNEFSKTCVECDQKVCEDCASYSKLDECEFMETWRCSVCRRKMASRVFIPQESTDSVLEIPVLETLQRRHSDVKLGSTQCLGVDNGTALVPPRSPELRRHSDVSPASLKELEKLKGAKAADSDWRKGHSAAPSRSSSPPRRMELETATSRIASRRPSMRMTRQRSYDDEIKSNNESKVMEPSLGLPAPMPRRKSAYDVYAPGVLASALQAASLKEPEAPGSRRPSFKMPVNDNSLEHEDMPSPDHIIQSALTVDEERRNKRRGSQLPDISALRNAQNAGNLPVYQIPALEDLEAPRRQTSLDGEAIKIVIHDVDSGPLCASKRRVVLQKDPADKAHRTRGFGMRVVGGKTGTDGRLFAYIVWTVPGGPAEKGGLQQGDKILEWCGTSLVDRSFEEVCAIMDRTGDVIELLVEHATDFRMCDLLDDGTSGNPNNQMKSNADMSNLGFTSENEPVADKSPSSPTRRKLPKTPEQLAREKQVSGRVQIQVWYHGDRNELVVSLMAGDDLPPRDESLGYGGLPEAYASIKLMPKTHETHVVQTEVSSPSLNPIWNATITFRGVSSDSLFDRYIDVALYDLLPQSEPVYLGECKVMLQKAFLDDVAVWYRLEDPKQLRGAPPNKMSWSSPRNSISGDVTKLIRGSDYRFQRSVSDDVDSIGDGSSLLHPDHAWAFSRRGSSQSETLEIETYQLGKDFSKSLPGSRRSSFQDQDKCKSGEMTPTLGYNRERRRSSAAKRNPEELRRAFNQSRGEFTRTMSLSRELEQKNSKSKFTLI